MPWRTPAAHATGHRSREDGANDGQKSAAAQTRKLSSVFESTAPFFLFDYFRVPYERAADVASTEVAKVSTGSDGPFLAWPAGAALATAGGQVGSFHLGEVPVFGRVAGNAQMGEWLRQSGTGWSAELELRDERGDARSAVWQRDDGSCFLPFDPNELISSYWSERYLKYVRPAALSRLAALARRGYYRTRPLLPRRVQMTMRRSFSRVQSKAHFPRWPIETALHDLYDLLFSFVAALTRDPIPYIAAWPGDRKWALVLTHDVETQVGYDKLTELLDAEVETGFRSSWNFVPQNRYVVADELVQSLTERGFEVGVHGLYHDGRDLASLKILRRRLPAIRRYADAWRARGFRSPGTLRSAELLPLLGFDYDSSYSDTVPFEPQPGGCCTWLPYMLGELVELPITVVQDHTLFDLLGHEDAAVWLEKARFLRDRGGMALFLTHPDYVGNRKLVPAYRRVLEEFDDDETVWKALPREVSDWWRRRSQSTLHASDGEWSVAGPAANEARVEFMTRAALNV